MGRVENNLAGKVYGLRKKYPEIAKFERRMREVERELNKNQMEQQRVCKKCGRPMCKDVCKNRQKP